MHARIPFLLASLILFLILGAGLIFGLGGVAQAGVTTENASQAQAKTADYNQDLGQDQAQKPQVPACGPDWSIYQSLSPTNPVSFFLTSVAAISANDVWAVGYTLNSSNIEQTLIEHWDGASWSAVDSPDESSSNNFLNGVAAVSTNDVWAVGAFLSDTGTPFQTLTEHWDGTSWSIGNGANQGTHNNVLNAVAVAPSGEVWAVGYYNDGTTDRTLTQYWDGSSWNIKVSPNQGTFTNILNGVAASSAGDIWAVGYYFNGSANQTLAEHWDGSMWSVVSTPNSGTQENRLTAVAMLSSTDVWAVGYYFNQNTNSFQTLAMQWTGQNWTISGSLNQFVNTNLLFGVTMASPTDVWVTGYYLDAGHFHTLIEKYDGTTWTIASSPNQGTDDNLVAISSPLKPDDVWVVGNYLNGTTTRTLIEHFDGSSWTVSPSANVDPGQYQLLGVSAAGVNNVWAVGSQASGSGLTTRTLIEYWGGGEWTIVASPNQGTGRNELLGVAALAPNNVWAVGDYHIGLTATTRTLIEHWNGSAWSIVASPNVGTGSNVLTAVSGVPGGSSSAVWAVGYYFNGSTNRTLIESWNGSSWSLADSVNVGSGLNMLGGVAAIAGNDVWAVGFYNNGSFNQTLIEQWDGTKWGTVDSPNAGTSDNFLNGVTETAANDVWAVGEYESGGFDQTLVERWNGSAWSIVASANPGSNGDRFTAIAATGPGNLYAVGFYNSGSFNQTLVEHWDGGTWSVMASPNFGTHSNALTGVAAVSPGDIWTVGLYDNSPGWRTLIERYQPCLPSPTPTSIPTSTRVATATSTPASCTISFSDVHPTDYFYVPVQYLYCHGVISGYSDNTFRPYNQTTRAQVVKINVLGFGIPIATPTPMGEYTFADIPPSQPFFSFIETAAAHNIVSGYSCGGLGEPCDDKRRPYFRPNLYVTRGQLSKIVIVAAGWPLLNPPTGTFHDVLPDTAFYQYIETAFCHGIISGYSCGGTGEPCDPTNRPYFRQYADATRGQIAKIVYLAITGPPSCGSR